MLSRRVQHLLVILHLPVVRVLRVVRVVGRGLLLLGIRPALLLVPVHLRVDRLARAYLGMEM